MNYDASKVGVPYIRAHKLVIHYPDNGNLPWVSIEQSLAVKLADGTVRRLEDVDALQSTFDLRADGDKLIPLVSPDTGLALGANTSLNNVMLGILAVVRQQQLASQAAL